MSIPETGAAGVVPAAQQNDTTQQSGLPGWSQAEPPGDNPSSSPAVVQSQGEAQEGEGTPIASIDAIADQVNQKLDAVEPGWPAEQLELWLYTSFLGFLAGIPDLSLEMLQLSIDRLIDRLKAKGYKPHTPTKYLATCKKLAKAKQAEQKAAQKAAVAEQQGLGMHPGRYRVRPMTLAGANAPEFLDQQTGQRLPTAPPLSDFQTEAIYDCETGDYLTNFTLFFNEEVEVRDELESRKEFKGEVRHFGKTVPFQIKAGDYADNNKLKAAIIEAAGSGAIFYGKLDSVREAISSLNWQPGKHQPVSRTVTTDFGWTADGTKFLVPSGQITAEGYKPITDQTELRVDLEGEELARNLDLRPLKDQQELHRLKHHIVDDLLKLHDQRVTHSLLAVTILAVLARFVPDTQPFVLWLTGLTGAGKSFLAKLFMNFFGCFPVGSGRFGAWASTPNYLQRQGYFFKDALYLIDDYKPEVVQSYQAVRIVQNYADRTGRGRLKSDATTNTSRQIRGQLISTGEDVLEHQPSAAGRSIILKVPQQDEKDLARGARCQVECAKYSGVMADLISHLLAQKRTEAFATKVKALRNFYYHGIAGKLNDIRIAGNLAMLGAAFFEFANYLADVWPEWKAGATRFLTEDLVAMRDEMVAAVDEQQPSEVFWSVLGTLVEHDIVSLDPAASQDNHVAIIGKQHHPAPRGAVAGHVDHIYCVSTALALAEVNSSLRKQGRPELKISAGTLIGQLRRNGHLVDDDGEAVAAEDKGGLTQVKLAGETRRGFLTTHSLLTGSPAKAVAGNGRLLPGRVGYPLSVTAPKSRDGAVTVK
jgi:hypothetical protein